MSGICVNSHNCLLNSCSFVLLIYVRHNCIHPDINAIVLALAVSHLTQQAVSTDMLCNKNAPSRLEPARCRLVSWHNNSVRYFWTSQIAGCLRSVRVGLIKGEETRMSKEAAALTGADVTCLSNDLLLSLL